MTALSLTDFRSWESLELTLEPGPTALVGANGQGKTNVVEALTYLSTLSSHRVSTDAPLVRAGAERAVVRGRVQRVGRGNLVELEINPGRANRARVNRSPVPRPREVLGLLRTVLFAPEDLALVRGDPSERRRFLDDLLALRTPRLAGVRSDYERVLKQRNALLKTAFLARRTGGSDMRTLDVWDAHLARTGSELLAARLRLVDDLAPRVATAYREVSAGQGETGLTYRSSMSDPPASADEALLAAALLAELARLRPAEFERGVSLVGPHRDELVLTLGGLPAKGYASHGESWSMALALRLASFALLSSDSSGDDGEPVLLLDDVFAELDAGRRERLAELVVRAEQVVVTAAVAEDVPETLRGGRLDVRDGGGAPCPLNRRPRTAQSRTDLFHVKPTRRPVPGRTLLGQRSPGPGPGPRSGGYNPPDPVCAPGRRRAGTTMPGTRWSSATPCAGWWTSGGGPRRRRRRVCSGSGTGWSGRRSPSTADRPRWSRVTSCSWRSRRPGRRSCASWRDRSASGSSTPSATGSSSGSRCEVRCSRTGGAVRVG